MSNIRMVVSIHDNDFFIELQLLGEFITKIMEYFNSSKLDSSLLNDDNYKLVLKESLLDMMISIYKLRHILLPRDLEVPFNLNKYKDDINHIEKWFREQFDLYFTEEEFDKAMSLIEVDSLSKNWTEIKHFDEFQMCNGNYEFLIIHCCDWECKAILV